MRRSPIPALLLALLACGLTAACGPSAEPSAEPAPAAPATGTGPDGTFDLVFLNRPQGFAEGIPCRSNEVPPLPGAVRLRDELRAGGQGAALLAVVGDTLTGRDEKLKIEVPALQAVTRVRVETQLAALGAAHPDVWVPDHGDFLAGVDFVLGRAHEEGIPVLLSNVSTPGHPEVKDSLLVEAGGLRIGLLSVLAPRVTDLDALARGAQRETAIVDAKYEGATILPVTETLTRLAADLHERQGANFVIALSTLGSKSNNGELAEVPGIDMIIGSSEPKLGADRIYILHDKIALMSALPGGEQVGRFTLHIEDGNLGIVDLTPRNVLPGEIAKQQAKLQDLIAEHGTSDPRELARRASPGNPQALLDSWSLLDRNREFLANLANTRGSTMELRPAELPSVPVDDPVMARFRAIGPAITQALADPGLPPVVRADLATSILPPPESCAKCHAAQQGFWAASAHSRALDPLRKAERLQDPACLDCHAAGFGNPAGWLDPRLEAPLGAVTCWNCHQVSALHAASPRLVVDPAQLSSRVGNGQCIQCHNVRRSPGFDLAASRPRVTCPPMRPDEPALLLARQGALDAIAERRAAGRADERDDFLEGRALVGLGRLDDGEALLARACAANRDDTLLAVESSRQLDRVGRSRRAQELLGDFVSGRPGDLNAAWHYADLLLHPKVESERHPDQAAAFLDLVLPKGEGDSKNDPTELRALQAESYFESGRGAEGRKLLGKLLRKTPKDEALNQLARKYLGG